MHIPDKKQTNYFAEPLEPILPTQQRLLVNQIESTVRQKFITFKLDKTKLKERQLGKTLFRQNSNQQITPNTEMFQTKDADQAFEQNLVLLDDVVYTNRKGLNNSDAKQQSLKQEQEQKLQNECISDESFRYKPSDQMYVDSDESYYLPENEVFVPSQESSFRTEYRVQIDDKKEDMGIELDQDQYSFRAHANQTTRFEQDLYSSKGLGQSGTQFVAENSPKTHQLESESQVPRKQDLIILKEAEEAEPPSTSFISKPNLQLLESKSSNLSSVKKTNEHN